jgi:hypothetical protein
MRRRPDPLLCELHAHTTWSDGALALPQLVDLYGRAGFDVLVVTDHVNRPDDPLLPPNSSPRGVLASRADAYLAEIEAEAARACAEYDLLVLPGAELSYNDLDPVLAAHAVAVGLRTHVPLDDGLEPALERARAEGAALIAAHPVSDAAQRRPRSCDAALRHRLARAPGVHRPLGALQPLRPLRLGRRARAAGGGDGRLPPSRAPVRLEDPAAVGRRRPWSSTCARIAPRSSPGSTGRTSCDTPRSGAVGVVRPPNPDSGGAASATSLAEGRPRPYVRHRRRWEDGW